MRKRPLCVWCLVMIAVLWFVSRWENPDGPGSPIDICRKEITKNDEICTVRGKVEARGQGPTSYYYILEEAYLKIHSNTYSISKIKLYAKEKKKIPIGAKVMAEGRVQPVEAPSNPGEFDAAVYYGQRGIFFQMFQTRILQYTTQHHPLREFLQNRKEKAQEILEHTAGEQAGILKAMILGEKGGLDQEQKTRYQMAGIVHILAISGLHLSVLGAGLFQLLCKAGAGLKISGAVSLWVVLLYGVFTGESTSAMRAVIMFVLAMGARIVGKSYDLITALAFSALLLALENPQILRDSGFLLSFGAVGSLYLIVPCLKMPKGFKAGVGVMTGTLPIVLYFFFEVSLAGIFLNLLVVPTAGIVLILGILAVGVGGCFLPAGEMLMKPVCGILQGYELLAQKAAGLPFCTWIAGKPSLFCCFGYYAVLVILIILHRLWKKRLEKEKKTEKMWMTWGFLGVMGVMACFLKVRVPEGFTGVCLDIGQGDAVVWTTPAGENYLVDGGSSSKKQVGTYVITPYLKSRGIRVLEGIFVTHTDEDHVNGIEEMLEAQEEKRSSLRIKKLYLPQWEEKPEKYRELEEKARKAGVQILYVQKGDRLLYMKEKEFYVQAAGPPKEGSGRDVNESSLVLKVVYGEFEGLYTGDAGEKEEKSMAGELGTCDYLKVGHHGSKNSSSTEFLEEVQPKIAVISCGEKNFYGHPARETIERLETAGARIFYTMYQGAVTIWTDGTGIQVKTYLP